MTHAAIRQAEHIWPPVAKLVSVPRNDEDYARLVELLDQLVDYVGEDEEHPLASLMDVIGVLIENYEDEHVAPLEG
jgi:HTH-type transcriptional regulator/antitoxin HigA